MFRFAGILIGEQRRSWHEADDLTQLKVRSERGTEVRDCLISDYDGSIIVLRIMMKAILNQGILINEEQVTCSLVPALYGVCAL